MSQFKKMFDSVDFNEPHSTYLRETNLKMKREGITEMHLFNPAARIRSSQVELLANVLTRAFYDDPGVEYILPDARTRRDVLSWFFTSVAIRTSRFCGEIYTTANVDGGALWICPGVELTIGHAVRTEMLSLPFRLDRSSIARWIKVSGYLESIRRELADEPHWHLIALGTERSRTAKAIRGALMAPVLAEADWDLRSCYVETFHERDLPFYKQCGFQIAGAGRIPKGGPSFWSLIRPPHREPINLGEWMTAAKLPYTMATTLKLERYE
jgi:hypothetical protein